VASATSNTMTVVDKTKITIAAATLPGYFVTISSNVGEPREIHVIQSYDDVTGTVTIVDTWNAIPSAGDTWYIDSGNKAYQSVAMGSNSGQARSFDNLYATQWTFTGWNTFEEHIRAADNYMWQGFFSENAGREDSRSDLDVFKDTDPGFWDSYNLPGFLGNFFMTYENLDIRYDNFYIAIGADAARRFVISDGNSIASSREVYIAPHTAWADGQVSIRLPYMEPGSDFAGKYLLYFDKNNVPEVWGQFQ